MLYVIAILFPAVCGTAAALVPAREERSRHIRYGAVMILSDLLALLASRSGRLVTLVRFTDKAGIAFMADGLGRVFLYAVLILFTAVLFYAFVYMETEERPVLFYAFFFLSLAALIGVCFAANMVTVYFCFEMATLMSMPMVLVEMTKEAVAAAQKYLFYSVAGALLGLLGTFFACFYASGDAMFVSGGSLDQAAAAGHEGVILLTVFLAVIGFGTKAGMYPMHGWLPAAHPIAPAPASSLLSGIIAKAGVIAVIRLVYYTVGADFVRGTWVQTAWCCLAMLTVLMGSTMAFREKIFKKRLAYSTISQISYCLLSLSVLTPAGLRGGLLQVMAHFAAKGCLFLCAGAFIHVLGIKDVRKLRGVGRKMPVTLWCLMFAALSLVGIPPMGGFLSKWNIAMALIEGNGGVWSILPVAVLLVSALLTAGYLFPIVVDGFFPGEGGDVLPPGNTEPGPLMTVPMIALCVCALAVGLFGQSFLVSLGL